MRRRDFMALLGAAAWPVAARAQQADRVPLIGVAMTLSSDDPESEARLTAFRQTLRIWAGSLAVTCGSSTVGVPVILNEIAETVWNW
jgi:hypothetical protein